MTGQGGGAKASVQLAAGLSNFFGPGQSRESGGRASERTDYPASAASSGESYDPPSVA